MRTVALVVTGATVASFVYSVFTTFHPPSGWGSEFAFYSPLTRAWEFGVGVLLALATPIVARRTRVVAHGFGIAGLALVGIAVVMLSGTASFPGYAALLPVVGTALLIAAGTSSTRGVAALLGARPAVRLGDVSYGWYLWHWPFIVFAAALWPGNTPAMVTAAVASLGVTFVSYRFVENPVRFNRNLVGRRVVPVAAACIGVPIVACIALQSISPRELHAGAARAFSAVARFHREAKPCNPAQPIGGPAATACTSNVAASRGTVVLVGDSNAWQFIEPVAKAANALGYDEQDAWSGGCPFAEVVRESGTGFDGEQCYRFVNASMTALTKSRPALVIIAMSSSQLVTGKLSLREPNSGDVATSPTARAEVYERGLNAVVAELARAGIPTVVVHPVPHLGDVAEAWQGLTCPYLRIVNHSCDGSIGRADVERQQVLARTAEDRAVAGIRGASTVDFTDALCSPTKCTTYKNGKWMYRDAVHLSVAGALTLTERFRRLIADHAVAR
jgi:hypothetical protein